MPATIEIIDQQDGSGVQLQVSGLVDTPLVFWYGVNEMEISGSAFGNSVTINTDGNTDLAIAAGPYQGVAVENGTVVGVYHFRASNTWEGTHYRCLNAVRDYVLAMALPLFPTDPNLHKVHKKPVRTQSDFKAATDGSVHGAHYWPLPETRRVSENVTDLVEYPVQIALVRSSGGSMDPDKGWMLARERLARALHKTALPVLAEVHTARVRPLTLYESSFLQVDLSSLIVTCETHQCFDVT